MTSMQSHANATVRGYVYESYVWTLWSAAGVVRPRGRARGLRGCGLPPLVRSPGVRIKGCPKAPMLGRRSSTLMKRIWPRQRRGVHESCFIAAAGIAAPAAHSRGCACVVVTVCVRGLVSVGGGHNEAHVRSLGWSCSGSCRSCRSGHQGEAQSHHIPHVDTRMHNTHSIRMH